MFRAFGCKDIVFAHITQSSNENELLNENLYGKLFITENDYDVHMGK